MDKEKVYKELDSLNDFLYGEIGDEFAIDIITSIGEILKPILDRLVYLLLRHKKYDKVLSLISYLQRESKEMIENSCYADSLPF